MFRGGTLGGRRVIDLLNTIFAYANIPKIVQMVTPKN